MLKTVEDISATRKRLMIEVPAEAVEKEIRGSLEKVRARTSLPGYRPGKAPAALIEKKFGKDVEAEVFEEVVSRSYAEALKEASLTPVAAPRLEGGVNFKRSEPLNLTLLVDVRPKIEGLNYDGVKVQKIPADIEDSDVEATLNRLRQDRASYEPTDRPVEDGDVVIMDYEAKEMGKSFKDEVFKVGSELLPGAFSDALVGLAKGGTTEVEVEFPQDFYASELAGKKDTFKVSIKEVKKTVLPALDDEFAKDMEFDTLDALKAHIRERLGKNKAEAVRRLQKAEAVKKVLAAHEFEAPESLVEQEVLHLMANAKAGGAADADEALREKLVPSAREHVRASILLQVIGEKEGVQVSEEEMKKRILETAARSNLSVENVMKYYLSKDGSLEGLRQSIFEEKVMDLVLERAQVEGA
jgi:trigger factor